MPVLSRVQQNDIFALAQKYGLDPADFDLATEMDRGTQVDVFVHRPTGSRYDIRDSSQGEYWVTWWPRFRDSAPNTFAKTWRDALSLAEGWLRTVKANHDAPDLWAEAHKARRFTKTTDEAQNTPFTKDELKELGPKLAEVEAFIESRQPLTVEQKAVVHSRFTYLLGAAKRGLGRIDWLNIFVGQVFSLFTDGVVASAMFKQVMDHAWTALGGVVRVGAKMLEEHLKS